MSIPTFEKDSSERLDYTVDWTAWMATGDTITGTPVWTVPPGITLDAEANDSTKATAWLMGGTAGKTYSIECRITTAQGRVAERSITIAVVNKR